MARTYEQVCALASVRSAQTQTLYNSNGRRVSCADMLRRVLLCSSYKSLRSDDGHAHTTVIPWHHLAQVWKHTAIQRSHTPYTQAVLSGWSGCRLLRTMGIEVPMVCMNEKQSRKRPDFGSLPRHVVIGGRVSDKCQILMIADRTNLTTRS